MVNGQPPPDGLNVFVSRLDPRDEESEAERHALLPIGSHLHEYAQSFLAAGMLDVTLIYNATQPIAHPLAAEGRVLRVWPIKPTDTLDLGSLPYVSRRDLVFLAA